MESILDKDCRASGFKLGQAHITERESIVSDLESLSFSAILITRRNLLDQFISMRLATLNNAWRSDYGTYRTESFQADPDIVLDSINDLTRLNLSLAKQLQSLRQISVVYEDLQKPGIMECILHFLGLPDAQMTSRFKRQRSRMQREILTNYDELKLHFSDHFIGEFFDEEDPISTN